MATAADAMAAIRSTLFLVGTPVNAARDILNATAIVVGDWYLGEVIELRCGSWSAADVNGSTLGTYSDARAALAAVLASMPHVPH